MIFRVADDRDLTAVFADNFSFGNRIFRVISSFRMKVGADVFYQSVDGRFVKYRHSIDTTKGRDDLGTLVFGHIWPAIAFKVAYLTVGIDPNDQKASELFGTLKVTDVTDMEQVKTSVGKDDLRSRPTQVGCLVD